ncbi:hypothetical protein LAZ67_12003577 [Cordylochernes scorpioides]|uniref:Mariner Mos1 transposase n=1 Tax=Cordylochernes scorpioides TaxID=51811 RepID=A0ABY6L397_9ARAC|nr:hypothetical protein LAZ67_12003577 [Cordylochernes scorpioides]
MTKFQSKVGERGVDSSCHVAGVKNSIPVWGRTESGYICGEKRTLDVYCVERDISQEDIHGAKDSSDGEVEASANWDKAPLHTRAVDGLGNRDRQPDYAFRLWPLTRRKLMRVIVVYDDHALVDRTCQNSNFDLEDKERPRALLKFEETRLDEDAKQTQKELTKTLGVTQPAILLRLKEIGMIRRVGNWVPCELKPRDVECRFSREKLLQRPKKIIKKGVFASNCNW